MAFPAIVAPIFLTGIALVAKIKYNEKLVEYFRSQGYTNSTLQLYGTNQYTATESTATKEIMKLKLLHSPRVFKALIFSLWLLFVLLSVMLEKIICQGWITGEKCALEKIGIPILSAAFMLLPSLGEIVIIYKKIKNDKSIDKPWLKHFDSLIFALGTTPGIIAGLIEIIYHQLWYKENEEIKLFPYLLTNIAFISNFYVLFIFYLLKIYQLRRNGDKAVKHDLSLDDILENEISRDFFQAFLVESLCVENLIFILHLRIFKSANEFVTENLAKKIYNYFIKEGSIAQVNISGKTRKIIKENIYYQNISSDIFEEAEEEVISLLTYDSLPKFKSSSYYPRIVNRFIS
eukprot:snap_masked-scaffold_27-processed-gene-3.11-mRNA-1 protein AED:1.00 eAED:1.00 QI:0/-1/0/0/-1/1/1/0/346